MIDVLPRETFKSAADRELELAVAGRIERWANAKYLHIGPDDPERQKSRIDGLFYRDDTVVAFAEIKSCSYVFGSLPNGWTTSEKKIASARALYQIVRVPVLLVLRFACGTVAYLDVNEPYVRIEPWGRSDRNSSGDVETGARFQWRQMKIVEAAT